MRQKEVLFWISAFATLIITILLCGCAFTPAEKQNAHNLKKAIESAQKATDAEQREIHLMVALECVKAVNAAIGLPVNPMPYNPNTAMYTAAQAEIDAKKRASLQKNLGNMSAMFLGINLATLPWAEILAGASILLGGGLAERERRRRRKVEVVTGKKAKEIEAEEKLAKVKNGYLVQRTVQREVKRR